MKRTTAFSSLTLLSILLVASPLRAAVEGYYRDPAIRGDTLVFAAEGDLWRVDRGGGIAQRLTTHAGEESLPALSPDGSTLAFSATYEGPTEVYTMPVDGGLPTRRTWEAEASRVVGWRASNRLVYTSRHYSTLPDPQLLELDLEAGTLHRIPLTPAENAAFTESEIFFTRPGFHRNNTKRYRGGTARNLWRFSESSGAEAVNLTSDSDTEHHSPMVWDGRLYFVTDRDGTMNVWSMNTGGADLRQHTRHSGWDVKSPAIDAGRVVYQLGADLWLLDIATDSTAKVPITLASDFDQLREKWVKEPMDYLTSVSLHPDGKSVVLTARGRVFVVPARSGRLVRVSRAEGVRYRDASFTSDGQSLLAFSDETGEVELWELPARGLGERRALTSNGEILRFAPLASPDGKRAVYTDRNNDLWVIDLETGDQERINQLREGAYQPAWSHDGQWLAYVESATNTYSQIHLVNVEDGRRAIVTSDRVNSYFPAFSRDGEWLFFISDRHLRSSVPSPWGARQPEPYFERTRKLYQVGLQPGLRPTFRPADELLAPEAKEEEKEQEEKEGESDEVDEVPAVEITLDGLQKRFWELPVPPGDYFALAASDKSLLWLKARPGSDGEVDLVGMNLDREKHEIVTIVEDVRFWDLSADGKKILVRKGDALYVIDAKAAKAGDLEESKLDLSGWTFSLDVREDLRQLFVDAWRLERDYFYDPNMHGVDWQGVRDKYLPLVERVTTRAELSDLIGEVVGELSALHVSVRGGDHRRGTDTVRLPTLGARLARDPEAGGYRVEHIYRAEPDYADERSPLADPFVGVADGDVLVAINGVSLLSVPDPGVTLRGQAGKQVLVDLLPAGEGESRQIIVTPTTREAGLRYSDWEYSRRLRTEELGGGKIGYVHLRAMGGGNLTEWYRNFYPVFNRQGLILDMRHNRGGNIDSIILEKLLRRAWSYWKPRTGETYWNMQYAFRGHMLVLVDENTASDGEAFAEGFRRLGLGKVLGVRTWGGEIWLSSNNRLSDGGLARAPQTGVFGPEREWLIEGHGVDPDITVQNLPRATFEGGDAQLEAAVELLLQEIERDPRNVPEAPAYPDKSFDYHE